MENATEKQNGAKDMSHFDKLVDDIVTQIYEIEDHRNQNYVINKIKTQVIQFRAKECEMADKRLAHRREIFESMQ